MERQCSAIKANGQRCQKQADGEHGFCWSHAPENAEHRRRIAARGAKGRGNSRLHALDELAADLYERVENGELDPSQGNTMIRILAFRADLIKLERDSSIEDIIEELEALKREVRFKPGKTAS
jgi:hypothetical protein